MSPLLPWPSLSLSLKQLGELNKRLLRYCGVPFEDCPKVRLRAGGQGRKWAKAFEPSGKGEQRGGVTGGPWCWWCKGLTQVRRSWAGCRPVTAQGPRVWSAQGLWPELLLLDQAKFTPQPSDPLVSVPHGHQGHLVGLSILHSQSWNLSPEQLGKTR